MNLLVKSLKSIKDVILPSGAEYRRLPFGIVKGNVMKIDFHHNFRQFLGMYEFELNPYFKELVRPGYRCFDVGGKGGYNALMMARLSDRSEIVSFECEDEAIAELHEVFSKNPYDIKVQKGFVSNEDTSDSITLDKACKDFFTPDFIKMDIEGAEICALEGASNLLKSRKPHLIIEVHGKDKEKGCLSILNKHEYDVQIVDQTKILPEKRETFSHIRWLICRGQDKA